jgi:hypothetical protein
MSRNGTLVIFEFTSYLRIVYAKLATKWKLRGVSTYLPNLEALCLEHIWNTHSATLISNLSPRPLSGQKYIHMSPLDSYEFY